MIHDLQWRVQLHELLKQPSPLLVGGNHAPKIEAAVCRRMQSNAGVVLEDVVYSSAVLISPTGSPREKPSLSAPKREKEGTD